MKPDIALKTILLIAIGGTCFSGYLTFVELFGERGTSCPTITPIESILRIPACTYGFILFAAILAITIMGLRKK